MMLRSRELVTLGQRGSSARSLADGEEFRATLREVFDVPLDDIGERNLDLLWDRAVAQHQTWRQRDGHGIATSTKR